MVVLATVCAPAAQGQAPAPGGPPMVRPGGPGPMMQERKILDQFDADHNGRLEGKELEAAREELKKNPAPQGLGPGFGPGNGRRPPFGPPPGMGGERVATKPGPKVTPAEVKSYPDAPLYAPDVVRTIFLTFDNPAWEEDLELFHGTDVDLPAIMVVDGKEYKGVGVHFRGSSSYMMVPRGTKRSLNVSVDHTDSKARLYGYTTLNLLNANGDSSMMSSTLYSDLAAPHIPVPKANFVQVVINGELWGVYANLQQFNKSFTREHWPQFKGDGARWKVKGSPGARFGLEYTGDDVAAYRQRYELKTKDTPQDWQDLIALCKVLNQTPADQLEEALKPRLDIDGVLWFLALDVASANEDGYWVRSSDYSLYKDPEGVFHVIPHDMNEAFKSAMMGPPGPPGMRGPRGRPGEPGAPGQPPRMAGNAESMITLDPLVGLDDAAKPLRSKLLAVPALRQRYLSYVKQLATAMQWERMGPTVQRLRTLLKPLVEADTRKAFSDESFDRETSSGADGQLRLFFEKRSAYLLGYSPRASAPAAAPASTPAPPAAKP
ncbi:MAG: CotH kinase family protein [Phycisphaerales bacterium]